MLNFVISDYSEASCLSRAAEDEEIKDEESAELLYKYI